MSSRVYAIIPAGAGLTRSSRKRTFEDFSSSHTSGCADPRRASRAGWRARSPAALPSEARPPSARARRRTTERYVRIANEMRNATVLRQRRLHEPREQRLADGAEEDREDRDADLHRRDEPDGVVHEAQRRLGAATAALGALLQPRARRPVMRAYSAATKTAFPSTSRNTMTMRREVLTPRQGRRYSAGSRRPR